MLRARAATFVVACLLGGCSAQVDDQPATDDAAVGSIERLAPEFDEIVPRDAVLEVLAEGHGWTEGPVWVPELGGLLYSDIPANTIYLYRDDTGSVPWLTPSETSPGGSGGSNGLFLSREGRLLLAQHADRRIARLEVGWDSPAAPAPGAGFTTLASEVRGGRLNSPNDLVQGPLGDIYFTDPPYGLAGGDEDPAKELSINAVYRLRPDGGMEVIDATLARPNGIALSPDARTLYVASSAEEERVVVAYAVRPEGSVGERRPFADSWGDGLAVDQAGNVYVAEPERGVFVFGPNGRHLGSILTGQRTSNVAWGDDGSTLYITADSHLMRVRLRTAGVGF